MRSSEKSAVSHCQFLPEQYSGYIPGFWHAINIFYQLPVRQIQEISIACDVAEFGDNPRVMNIATYRNYSVIATSPPDRDTKIHHGDFHAFSNPACN